MFSQLIQVPESKNLPPGGEKQLFHVLPADAETAPGDTGHDFESRLVGRLPFETQGRQMLNASYLVPGGAVVFGDFGFNDKLRAKFVRNDEIRGLIETSDALRPFGLAEAYSMPVQFALDSTFKHISYQFANGISMRGKRPSQKSFVKEHGVRNT